MACKNWFVPKCAALSSLVAATALCFSAMASAAPTTFDGGLPVGWTGIGSFGTSGADGVVTASPEGGAYGWVSTANGVNGAKLMGVGGYNGSVLQSSVFSAGAGDSLEFYFNYITSDGGDFSDYAWARLLLSDLTPVAMLITARTNPVVGGSSVPGVGLPQISAEIDPSAVQIIGGAPVWSPLGDSSNTCFDVGCGYSGWVKSQYTIANAGNYVLEFGVSNWTDGSYHSGLAFDGIAVASAPPPLNPVSEPASLALLGLGLAGLVWRRGRPSY